jgi:hypothetical protein
MKFSHALITSASPEKIWLIWTDVLHWSEWDTELLSASLDGDFVLGATGKLTPKNGVVSSFQISQLDQGKSYTFTTKLPLCNLSVYRYLSSGPEGTEFTHEVSFQGILSVVFGLILGKQFQKVLPQVMANIKGIAEARS